MALLLTGLAFFWFGLMGLLSVWIVYPAVLWVAARLRPPSNGISGTGVSTVTVLVAAHNEAGNIVARLDNIFEQEPLPCELNVLIALDHCSDETEALVRGWSAHHPERRVEWFECAARGKAMAHNEAMTRVDSDLVVFTDADTIFVPDFLTNIVAAFSDSRVGFASGVLTWRGKETPEGASHFPVYWRFETWLRLLESRLDLCAVGTGACSAMRPSLFVPLHPTSDSDCSTPLDVVRQGSLCRIVAEAHAIDFVADTVRGEFRARVRMTAKNFMNTIDSWPWLEGIARHPYVTVGLLLHKIGRWLTPYFAVFMLIGGILASYVSPGLFVTTLTLAGIAGLLAALIGILLPSIPLLGQLGSFAIANAAFALGVFKALTGKVPTSFGKAEAAGVPGAKN